MSELPSRVRLYRAGGSLAVTVSDDGAGFDPEAVPPDRFGLFGLRERAGALGGSVSIDSAPGRGTVISVVLPCGEKDFGSP